MTSLLPPEPRDLPADRLEERTRHLLAEITASARGAPGPLAPAGAQSPPCPTAGAIDVVATVATRDLRWGTTEASAAQVRAGITTGLSVPRSIRGAFTVETRPPLPRKQLHGCSNCKPPLPVASTFVLAADGSFSSRALAPTQRFPASVAYNADTDVITETAELRSSTIYLRGTGNNPAFTSFRPESALATWVLHALDSGDVHVTDTSLDGRDAWALKLTFVPGDDYYDTYGARVDVVVDKETGLLLKLTQYANDPSYWTSIETIHDLTLDAPTAPGDFVLPVPPHARVVDHDFGFKRVTAGEAAAIVGYRPLLPTATGGRTLTRLAAAGRSQLAFLADMKGPVLRNAVTARYGDGLGAITVSTRRGTRAEIAPELSARTITVARGPLAGTTAYVSTSPTAPGYLSAYHDGLVIEISAASEDDAVAAAESLHPV